MYGDYKDPPLPSVVCTMKELIKVCYDQVSGILQPKCLVSFVVLIKLPLPLWSLSPLYSYLSYLTLWLLTPEVSLRVSGFRTLSVSDSTSFFVISKKDKLISEVENSKIKTYTKDYTYYIIKSPLHILNIYKYISLLRVYKNDYQICQFFQMSDRDFTIPHRDVTCYSVRN